MDYTSWSGAVHSFNSLDFFPVAKCLWGFGGRQHLTVQESRSLCGYPSCTVRQVPQDCQSQTGPRFVILENGKISEF